MKTPFRYDYVGSFLRPEKLKKARELFDKKQLTEDELRKTEDECITELIGKIKDSGYHVITDGEFRRSWWHYDFFWGFNGMKREYAESGLIFKGMETRADFPKLQDKINGENHPFIKHYQFIKQFEDEKTIAKMTFPSPSQFLKEFDRPENKEQCKALYPQREQLKQSITDAYTQVIQDLYAAGCRNIQMDDCSYSRLLNKEFLEDKILFEKTAAQYLEINQRVLENAPKDIIINKHMCRGNYRSHYFAEGAYDIIAPYFLKERINAFYLEYDDERSGGFEILQKVSADQKVVLGLITTKKPQLESAEHIIKRIEEASKYIDLERLYLSPQCGFSSTEEGNEMSEEDQWKKLRLVKEIAEKVWKDA